jgi:RNase P subunit RPR2
MSKGAGKFPQDLEGRFSRLEERVDSLTKTLSQMVELLEKVQNQLAQSLTRYMTICPSCKSPFDLLPNHYSIGLFDNLVYVKCPKCNKAMPVVDGGGSGPKVVAD